MITSIGLRNFKAFGDYETTIPLAPITLIYGPNSAGKSSIIQALRLMKQSYNQPYTRIFNPKEISSKTREHNLSQNSNFDAFLELVHNHDHDRQMAISVSIGVPEESKARKYLLPNGADSSSFSRTYQRDGKKDDIIMPNYTLGVSGKLRFDINGRSGETVVEWHSRGSEKVLYDQLGQTGSFKGSFDDCLKKLKSDYPAVGLYCEDNGFWTIAKYNKENLPKHRPRANNQAEVKASLQEELDTLWSSLDAEFSSLHYVGPQRDDPRKPRTALSPFATTSLEHEETSREYVGEAGEYNLDCLANSSALIKKTNEWLSRLDVNYYLDELNLDASGELLLQLSRGDSKTDPMHTDLISQVGFGISQILPIVVQSVLGRNETIVIEQPELHIHPRLQAELGDLFMETSHSELGNQYIIETHSETLVLRLQRRIRESRLSVDDVSIVYVEPSDSGARVLELRLDEYGNFIDEWPDGFFEEDFEEVFA